MNAFASALFSVLTITLCLLLNSIHCSQYVSYHRMLIQQFAVSLIHSELPLVVVQLSALTHGVGQPLCLATVLAYIDSTSRCVYLCHKVMCKRCKGLIWAVVVKPLYACVLSCYPLVYFSHDFGTPPTSAISTFNCSSIPPSLIISPMLRSSGDFSASTLNCCIIFALRRSNRSLISLSSLGRSIRLRPRLSTYTLFPNSANACISQQH